MKKTEEKPLTPYQQSLIDQSKGRSAKQIVRRWTLIFLVTLVASGFLARSYDVLPAATDGWLVLATAVYISLNWVAVAGLLFVVCLFSLLKFFMTKAKESEPPVELVINGEIQKAEDRSRSAITSFLKATNFFGGFNFSIGTIVDITADWFLFVVLVTVNHPYMALLHGASLLSQYSLYRKLSRTLLGIIGLLPDPLEQTDKTNIDELMDKLCNPDQEAK